MGQKKLYDSIDDDDDDDDDDNDVLFLSTSSSFLRDDDDNVDTGSNTSRDDVAACRSAISSLMLTINEIVDDDHRDISFDNATRTRNRPMNKVGKYRKKA